MIFSQSCFIKPAVPFLFEAAEQNLAPMFRRLFISPSFQKAEVSVCGLGFGYFWLNGIKITEDLFCAPVSDYNKTLWYNTYDVSGLLKEGENVFCSICGNGWYNEGIASVWNHNKAKWRDLPKFILELRIDDKVVLVSDEYWKCSINSPIIYNQLRSGEYYDSRLYDPNWNTINYDDSSWNFVLKDQTPPLGRFRLYSCQPVKECSVYPTVSIFKVEDKRYIFDIGQNISGYIRLHVKQKTGDVITIRYAEQINSDLTLQLNGMDKFFPQSPFQTDRLICNGEDLFWSPMFAYHGFRYIELTGIENPTLETVKGVFVHLDVNKTASFDCSDQFLNHLFKLGQMATLCNLHHVPTDCPTREKLGWANDAQASAEQMLTCFDTRNFFEKWFIDIADSMRDDGAIPGIIPTWGWGYEWGTGPVSSGVLFEIPYKIYLFTGDAGLLKKSLPIFVKHLSYILSRADDDGLIGYGLCDWAGPFEHLEAAPTPVKFTDTVLTIKCMKIASLAAKLVGDEKSFLWLQSELKRLINLFTSVYMNNDGTCIVNEQTAVSMIIYHGLYDRLEPLANQLLQTVQAHDYHHHCGMVGLRHLYEALNICGYQEVAYRIINAEGYPSYRDWVEGDATTLWETWQPGNSKNHHMYSDFMSWIMKTLVGISPVIEAPGFAEVNINPAFISQLDYCSGYCDTIRGRIIVNRQRKDNKTELFISLPEGVSGRFKGQVLESGEHRFLLKA